MRMLDCKSHWNHFLSLHLQTVSRQNRHGLSKDESKTKTWTHTQTQTQRKIATTAIHSQFQSAVWAYTGTYTFVCAQLWACTLTCVAHVPYVETTHLNGSNCNYWFSSVCLLIRQATLGQTITQQKYHTIHHVSASVCVRLCASLIDS